MSGGVKSFLYELCMSLEVDDCDGGILESNVFFPAADVVLQLLDVSGRGQCRDVDGCAILMMAFV